MPHVSRRRAAGAFAALLAVAGLAAVPARAVEDFTLTRIAGQDRYETAANAALEAFAAGADAAVLARGDAFPDALAGSYLTGVLGAPVLLTETDSLPASTSEALDALGAQTVYLLGGDAAISEAVAEEAAGEGDPPRTVERVAGNNRYATAAAIATGQGESAGQVGAKRAGFLVSGENFADALASGPIAHAQQLPILLTPRDSLAPETASAIDTLGLEHLVVVGGTAAVSEAVVADAGSDGVTTERVAGANRYATAAAVADWAITEFDTIDSAVDLATGEKFADALAAGPAAGETNRPLILTRTASLSTEARDWLSDHAGSLQDGRVFGGTAAVTDAVVAAAEAAASGEVAGASSGQLTFADTDANTYRFVPDDAEVGSTVDYADGDTFVVDGSPATVGGFEGAVTPGDQITHVPAEGSSAGRHELTNVAATSIVKGTVGNVDVADKQLDFVHPVNGDAVRSNMSWASVLYEVDGAAATQANFEADVNEGDLLEITGTGGQTTWELTNADVVGSANSIVPGGTPVARNVKFKIGALGDIAAAGSDGGTDPAGNDDAYQAEGADTFTVEGAESDFAAFSGQLTPGDAVTYRREASVEHFELVNRAPSLIIGQAVDDLDPASGPFPGQEGGGSFTVVTDDGPEAVTYAAGGTYVVDGRVANEAEFEAAYSAGDEISFRQADAPSGTTQRLQLTNKALQGPVGPETVDTEADTYGVIGQDGETVLATVAYTSDTASANTYFVNGGAVTLGRFEQELEAIKAETRSGEAQVQTSGSGSSAVTQHRLTTTGAPITTTTTTTAAP